ncbi:MULTISPECIES: sporulation protein YpjB [Bacillus]|uniref:sporulation protein YpjB n=1 Tax=Bacillus TaxID=1386 RepID=UPI0002EB8212|nr:MULTISPECIES: sporulation protein YpjB [Bacillus]
MFNKVTVILVLLFFSLVTSTSAVTSSNKDKLVGKTDEALQMTKLKRYGDSITILNSFSDQFLLSDSNIANLHVDERRIVTAAYDEAVKALENENVTHDYKVNAVTKLRLVVDAIYSQYQPLWTEMEERMMSAFSETKKAVSDQNSQSFNNELNNLLVDYDLIYYSLKVDLSEETIQKIDSKFQYLDHYRPQVFENSTSVKDIEVLQNDMKTIFEEMKEDEADPSLWWVIISTGSIIIGTLSYVGWRKYRGAKQSIKKRE